MHTPRMGDRPARRRRVIIEDARRTGGYLRATWHPATRQFVVSTWRGDVCTGAARVSVEDAADLAGLLVDGLADGAAAPATAGPAERGALHPRVLGLLDRARAWLRRVGADRPSTSQPSTAATRAGPLPRVVDRSGTWVARGSHAAGSATP